MSKAGQIVTWYFTSLVGTVTKLENKVSMIATLWGVLGSIFFRSWETGSF